MRRTRALYPQEAKVFERATQIVKYVRHWSRLGRKKFTSSLSVDEFIGGWFCALADFRIFFSSVAFITLVFGDGIFGWQNKLFLISFTWVGLLITGDGILIIFSSFL